MVDRLGWGLRRQAEFWTPLSVDECRQRLTGEESPASYGLVTLPGKRGVVRPKEFFIEDGESSLLSAPLAGTLTPSTPGTLVTLRDASSQLVYAPCAMATAAALAMTYLWYLDRGDIDLRTIGLLISMYAIVVGYSVHVFRRRQLEMNKSVDFLRSQLEA